MIPQNWIRRIPTLLLKNRLRPTTTTNVFNNIGSWTYSIHGRHGCCFSTLSNNSNNSHSNTSAAVKCDAIVIGAGIAGTSMAYELSKHGLKVIILEQEHMAGYHSTGRAAGLFSENYGTKAVKIMTMYSRPWFEAPPTECITPSMADTAILTHAGLLAVAEPDCQDKLIETNGPVPAEPLLFGGGGGSSDDYFAQLSRQNLHLITKQRAVELNPLLNADYLADTCVHEPHATDLNINLVHTCYMKGCQSYNVPILYDMSVDMIEKQHDSKGGHWDIFCNQHNGDDNDNDVEDNPSQSQRHRRSRFESSLIINASGAWADEIALKANTNGNGNCIHAMDVAPLRRCIVTFPAANAQIQSVLDQHLDGTRILPWVLGFGPDGKDFWYFAPQMKSGLFLASPANRDLDEPSDAQITDLESAICVDRIERYTHLRVEKIRHRWAGHRTHSQDNNPIIGPDANEPSFVWAAALAGQGIQSCPGYSQICANVVVGKPIPPQMIDLGFEFGDISPNRFAIHDDEQKKEN